MDERSLKALEWERVTTLLSLCASTEEGRRLAGEVRPHTEAQRVAQCRKEVIEGQEGEHLCGRLSLEGYGRCPTQVVRGDAFPLSVLVQARRNLLVRREILRWLDDPAVDRPLLRAGFPGDSELDELLQMLLRILDPRGEVADDASPALKKIRSERERLRGSLQMKMESLVGRFAADALQEATYTIRNGRLVLPVLTNRRSKVRGILHDTSSTGATLFVEPMEVVEDNNRLAELEAEEREEIQRILLEVSAAMSGCADSLEAFFGAVEALDLVLARGRLGQRYRGILPPAEPEERRIRLRRAFHPLLDERLHPLRAEAWGERRKVRAIPLDLDLEEAGVRTLVISGPNAGGKTVALKTVGLLAAMVQAGIPIPADEGTSFPHFPFLFASLGDDQSILESLSTFSARMVHLKDALGGLREPFLVLLDELGAGTDPVEGGALGEATLLELHRRRGYVLSTTHHESLKARALVTEGMGNAGMEFDERSLMPTYRLCPGEIGASRALVIAQRMGLPEVILDTARDLLPGEEKRLKSVLEALDDEIAALAGERKKVAAEEARLVEERAQLLHHQEELRNEKQAFLKSLPQRMDAWEKRFLEGLKAEVNLQSVHKKARKRIPSLSEEIREEIGVPVREAPPPESLPRKGDHVELTAYGVAGEVVSVDPSLGAVTVTCEGKTVKVGLGDVALRERPEAPATRGGVRVAVDLENFSTEVNLIGRTVAEAEAELVPFLDRAALSGLPHVRIIHGIGTGRLRTAVHAFLRTSPHVRTFEEAAPRAGGAGATEVTLK